MQRLRTDHPPALKMSFNCLYHDNKVSFSSSSSSSPTSLFLSFFLTFCHYLVLFNPPVSRFPRPLSSCLIKYSHFKLLSVLVFISFHLLSFDRCNISSFGNVSLCRVQLWNDWPVMKISYFSFLRKSRTDVMPSTNILLTQRWMNPTSSWSPSGECHGTCWLSAPQSGSLSLILLCSL